MFVGYLCPLLNALKALEHQVMIDWKLRIVKALEWFLQEISKRCASILKLSSQLNDPSNHPP